MGKRYTTMRDAIEQEVIPALGEYASEYDVQGIADEVFAYRTYGPRAPGFEQQVSESAFWNFAHNHQRVIDIEQARIAALHEHVERGHSAVSTLAVVDVFGVFGPATAKRIRERAREAELAQSNVNKAIAAGAPQAIIDQLEATAQGSRPRTFAQLLIDLYSAGVAAGVSAGRGEINIPEATRANDARAELLRRYRNIADSSLLERRDASDLAIEILDGEHEGIF